MPESKWTIGSSWWPEFCAENSSRHHSSCHTFFKSFGSLLCLPYDSWRLLRQHYSCIHINTSEDDLARAADTGKFRFQVIIHGAVKRKKKGFFSGPNPHTYHWQKPLRFLYIFSPFLFHSFLFFINVSHLLFFDSFIFFFSWLVISLILCTRWCSVEGGKNHL